MSQISCTVDTWIDEESLPVTPTLKVIRKNDPWYGMSEEEVDGRKEFIRCYINKDFEVLLQIPSREAKTISGSQTIRDSRKAHSTLTTSKKTESHSTSTAIE